MAEIEIEGLTLRFGGLVVLDGVSFAVEPGELFALIGPNGAGKTSVLNCISGLYRGGGTIRFRGQELGGRSPHDIARRGIARTFQHGELFADMTVIENLLTGRHARVRTNPFAEMLFLPGVRREEVRQRAAVGFARALALEPALLLLDEPSAGLNRDEREDLARFILRIKHRLGIPMIWIEHDMQMVADLADRIHVLDYGRTLAEGRPSEVLKHPDVIRAYLGGAKDLSGLSSGPRLSRPQ